MALVRAAEGARQSLSRSTLRRLLLRIAPTPADFDRLCIDYAPQVRARFSSGMDRVTQTNLLLRLMPEQDVLAALRGLAGDPPSFEQSLTPLLADPRNTRECELEGLSQELEECLLARDRHRSQGEAAESLDLDGLNRRIVELKRQIRRGPQLNPGEILAERYILCELIGRGGYGDVWQALDRHRQQFVAIKVLHGRREDPRSVERFERGARTMRQLNHQHIARVLEEPADHEDFHYYVMEYLPGGDLERALTQGRIRPAQALAVILQAGEALSYAHARGLVHRDVKPPNILLDREGRAHLTDFDLVLADDSTGGTATGAFVGTILYVAPEVLDDAGQADARSDVYALGMSLLFVLYGRPLPRSGSRDSLLAACSPEEPALLDIAARATASRAAERYASAAQFCDALRSALQAADLGSGEPSQNVHVSPALFEAETSQPLERPQETAASLSSAVSWSVPSSPSPSQQSLSLTGFALPDPAPSPRRRWLVPGLAAALSVAALSASVLSASNPYSAQKLQPPVAAAPLAAPHEPPSLPNVPGAPIPETKAAEPPALVADPTPATKRASLPKGGRLALANQSDAARVQPPGRPAREKRSRPAPTGRALSRSTSVAKALPGDKPRSYCELDVQGCLGRAQLAYLNRHYQQAIDVAQSVVHEKPAQAWLIIGNAACQLDERGLAATAHRHLQDLDSSARKYMLSVCAGQRLVPSGDEFVKQAAPLR